MGGFDSAGAGEAAEKRGESAPAGGGGPVLHPLLHHHQLLLDGEAAMQIALQGLTDCTSKVFTYQLAL